MLLNNLKISWRRLWLDKTTSSIHIFSLALGIASCLLISAWIFQQFQVDSFHEKEDRLFQVWENQYYSDGTILSVRATPGPLKKVLEEEMPNVAKAVRTTWEIEKEFRKEQHTATTYGIYADDGFFQVFTFPLSEGDANTALSKPDHIVISQKMADQLFPDETAVGQSVEIINEQSYTVTGVMKNIPKASTLYFDYVLPFKKFESENEWLLGWQNNGPNTWVLLKKGTLLTDVENKLTTLIKKDSRQKNTELFLQSIKDRYLYTNYENGQYAGGGRIEKVRLFGVIALLIFLISCINFISLTTARVSKRAKEVGIRKVIGANKRALVGQFFTEAILISFLALLIGTSLLLFILPYFNTYTNSSIVISMYSQETWIGLTSVFLLTILIAGSYPSFVLSSFGPLTAITNRFKQKTSQGLLRNILVVGQFTVAIALIAGTWVVFQQIQFLQQKEIGFNQQQLLYIPIKSPELAQKYPVLKEDLLKIPSVQSVSACNQKLNDIRYNTSGITWKGMPPEEDHLFTTIGANFDFVKTTGLSLKEGRDFSIAHRADSMNVIINEAAAKLMGMDAPIGESLYFGEEPAQIIGLVKDFHMYSLKYEITPAVLYVDPDLSYVYVQVATDDIPNTLANLEQTFNSYQSNFPFDYQFADEKYSQYYQSERFTSQIAILFSILALLLCGLGVLGLTIFSLERRLKEIGIRKVLGASAGQIVGLFSKNILQMVGLAFFIATPIAYYFSQQWLEDFAYRIEITWWVFPVVGLGVLLFALLTISLHSLKAAVASPISSLRKE